MRPSFTHALEENPAPRRLGDVRLRFEPGRLIGESLPPPFAHRLLPLVCLVGAMACALGAVAWLLLQSTRSVLPSALLSGLCAGLVGAALWLEARLGRRRFVLHFLPRTLRLEYVAWAPSATRVAWVPFAQVQAVEVEEYAPQHHALVVTWQLEGQPPQRAVLAQGINPLEEEALLRVWRLLMNAFGLKGAGLAGG